MVAERDAIRRAMEKLSPLTRDMLTRHLTGCSNQEIAALHRKPVGTIKARISRAKKIVAEEYQKE